MTTRISTNATSASTSSSRCTATCHCCTRSFEWTPCCLRLVYPTTRPSASSSSSIGLSGPAKSQKQSGLKDWKYFKKNSSSHCEQWWRWMDGLPHKCTEGPFGVRMLPRGIDKLTLKAVGLWCTENTLKIEWKRKGTTANKISLFRVDVTPPCSCSSITLNHQPLQMSFAPLNGLLRKEGSCTQCTETLPQ